MPFPLDAYKKRSIEEHFKKKGDFSWSEDFFLHVIDTSGSKYDLQKAAIGLREVGTEKAVERLRTLLMYSDQDVKCIAILTIGHISGAKATPIFIEALENPAYSEKNYALWAIADSGDERAISAVRRYLHKNKSRFKQKRVRHTPMLHIVDYVLQFSNATPDAQDILEDIAEIWFELPERERKAIERKYPKVASQFDNAQSHNKLL